MILGREFYEQNTLIAAEELLGKSLVHATPEGTTTGKIVETEAYFGPEDKASHAYNNLRTERTRVLFGPKGHAYIYQIYGMYFCLNITTGRVPGKPEAVLVRALEPIAGIEIMAKRRRIPKRRIYDLTGGPGKLCMAMGISKKQNDADLCTSRLHIEKMARIDERSIVQTRRVNVDYADEWKNRPWRFFIKNNPFVSRQTGR